MARRAVIIIVVLAVSLAAAAQQQIQQQQQVQRPGAAGASAPDRPKPSAEMQQKGRELLQMAEAGASSLEGGMRAFALLQVARGYEPSDKKKASELLESAFASTRSMDDDKQQTRQMLQENVLDEMINLAPESAEQHLAEMSPGFHKNAVLTTLLGYYEKQHQLDHAVQMVYRIGGEQEIPYEAVQRILKALPPEQNADALQLFSASLASYRNHKHNDGMMSTGDFPEMIVSSWKRLPPQVVHEAIDEVLQQADPANNTDSKAQPFNMSMASDKGAVAFNSMYQWRMFQLLPVLRQIDPDEADALLKKSREVQTLLDKYPNGQDSLNSGQSDDGKGDAPHGSMSFSIGGGGPMRGPSPMEMQRVEKIIADAEKHPSEALTNAQTISDPKMKMHALISIARVAAKKDSSTAQSALEKATGLLDNLNDPQQEALTLRDIADVYLRMGEQDDAKKTIERGLKAADKLYKQDSSGDDPNTALKAYWPSTEAYRSMLRMAGRISPVWAVSLLKDLPDNEVKVMAETALAAGWLDVPVGSTTIMTSNKKGTNTMMQMGDSR